MKKEPEVPSGNSFVSYITWKDDAEKLIALKQTAEGLERVQPVVRSHATDIYSNVAPNTSIRDGFDRQDYDHYRPGEGIPTRPKELIAACDEAYERHGIVKNVIDMMSDFVAKGVSISHPNERIERFHKELFHKKWRGEHVTERLASYLFRHGNVFMKRQTAKLKVRDEELLKKAQADPDLEVEAPPSFTRREVPWRFSFLEPSSVDLLSEELAPFVGQEGFIYGLKIPKNLIQKIKYPKTKNDRAILEKLPEDIKVAVRAGDTVITLDQEKLITAFYRRDDWKAWARPMTACILSDLKMLDKMKLADLAALDGAISCIRVWKLGSLAERIMPHPNMIARLAQMLTSNVGGGVMDLVWGPDIELLETSTEVHRYLGSTKYASTLQAIYGGLGIPQTLTGSDTATGFTNNYMSMKTLVERLLYARNIVEAIWNNELRLVQQAMGFRFQAVVVFDNILTDAATEQQLLLNMADRDLIDVESLHEELGFDPDLIASRLRREAKKRKNKMLPPKASPYHHHANHENELENIFAGTGAYTPQEFGLEMDEPVPGNKPPAEKVAKVQEKYAPKPTTTPGAPPAGGKPKGQPGQGRPKQKKDSSKRKQKKVKPRTSANFVRDLAAAEEALGKISRLTTPVLLKSVGKKTLRELTEQEARDFEEFKFSLLCQFSLSEEIDEDKIKGFLTKPLDVPEFAVELLTATVKKHIEEHGKEPAVEVLRRYQSSVFALYRGEYARPGVCEEQGEN